MNRFGPQNLLVVDMGTGSYYREQGGHERFNLDRNRADGKYYGYCPPLDSIDICKHFGAKSREGYVDGILVIYVVKKEKSNNREIIAFCPSARVYGRPQSGKGLNREFPNKKSGEKMVATYSIVSDKLIEVVKARLTIINDDTLTKDENTDERTSNRFRAQRFYGDKYPNLTTKIITYIEGILDEKDLIDDDFEEQEEIQKADVPTPSEIQGSANRPLSTVIGERGESVRKDMRYSKAALVQAKYTCQLDSTHKTFTTARGVPYMEGHHLIPCTLVNARRFEKEGKNIDCVENIVCICPNCHRAVHFGDKPTKKAIIKVMYNQQAKRLLRAGITITEEGLLSLYEKQP
jgi:5-methylcytosine-specific restriction protein A